LIIFKQIFSEEHNIFGIKRKDSQGNKTFVSEYKVSRGECKSFARKHKSVEI